MNCELTLVKAVGTHKSRFNSLVLLYRLFFDKIDNFNIKHFNVFILDLVILYNHGHFVSK